MSYNNSLVVQKPKLNPINAALLQDKSLRYTITYRMDISKLPKLNAIILDPEYKWNGHPKVSLEFKKYPQQEANLTIIYSALNLLNASYEYREISYEQSFAIEILRITSNSISAIAYLSNIYKEISKEASDLLIESLTPMMNWTIAQNQPHLAQDFSIWMAHWSDPEDISYMQYNLLPLNDYCVSNITLYKQEQAQLTLLEQKNQQVLKENQIKSGYRKLPIEAKEQLYKELIENVVAQRVSEILEEMKESNVREIISRAKYEESLHVFDNVEQCRNYLYTEYPSLIPSEKNMVQLVQKEFNALEGNRWDLEKIAKNTKDWTSLIATVIFEFSLGNALGGNLAHVLPQMGETFATHALPVIGKVLSGGKVTAIVTGLGLRNGWISPNDKEDSIDKVKFMEEFVCKAILCNAERFFNLTDVEQIKLSSFYGKHIFNSMNKDQNKYLSQSSIVDSYLNNLSDKNDLIGNYNQSECFNNIRNKLSGDTMQDDAEL